MTDNSDNSDNKMTVMDEAIEKEMQDRLMSSEPYPFKYTSDRESTVMLWLTIAVILAVIFLMCWVVAVAGWKMVYESRTEQLIEERIVQHEESNHDTVSAKTVR